MTNEEYWARRNISIHAPHARSDEQELKKKELKLISIHAPHARSDIRNKALQYSIQDFNPRSSCEERQSGSNYLLINTEISIHAPHARSDVHVGITVDGI